MMRFVLAALLLATMAADASSQQRVLAGRVVAAGSGEPVIGAEVRDVRNGSVTTSGADGSWRLPHADGVREIVVRHIGYAERTVSLAAAAADLRIELTPKPVSLGALIVTASRRSQELKDAVVATEVVDRAELRRTGSSDLAAVLVEHTGMAMEGGHPVGAGVMLQGLGSERVLVLMDGQPMLGRISGKLDLSRVPVSMVERVEVVKGPQSTLYGSDAMGGVVNVITRAPQQGAWQGGAEMLAGSSQRLDVGAHMLGGRGALTYTADAGRRSIQLVPGMSSDAGAVATRLDGAAKLHWRATPTLSLRAGGVVQDESQRWKSGALYSFADNVQWSARAGADWQRGGFTLSPTFYATAFTHLSRRSTQPQPVAGSGEEETQRLYEAELLVSGDVGRAQIDGGVEARRDVIDSDRVTGATRAMHAIEPFVQLALSGERWSVVPGARLAWSEQWGSHFTPRIAALFRPTPRVALRASVGEGFRAPSFKELYMEFLNSAPGAGYRVRGNAALQPESSRNVSGGIEWAGDRIYARAQLFYNHFDDFIETVELADSSGLRLFTYGNIDDGMTWGSELELGATWGGLRAEAGYSYLVAEDRSTGLSLLNRPTHSGRASLGYAHVSGTRATLTGVHTGSTLVSRSDAGDVVRSGFTRFDLRVARELPRGLELSAGVDNIADMTPELWPGFTGRQFHIGLAWQARRNVQ